jgi:hypothetical protein
MGEAEREALKQRLIAQDPKTLDPLIVRLMPDGCYELVDGEHRWRIAQDLGWSEVEVFVLEVDDLTAKARCVSSSLLRGHVNWFKLAEVVKQDLEAGINLIEAYKDILSDKVVKELFSLDNLVSRARLNLEEAVKKFATVTLYDLHMISQFPAYLQEELSEEYKTHPITSHSLAQTLNKYTNQNQPPTTTTTNQHLPREGNQNSVLQEKFDTPMSPNEALRRWNALKQQQKLEANPETTQTMPDKFNLDPQGNSLENAFSEAPTVLEEFRALLLTLGFCCECGRTYHAHFKDRVHIKNLDIVIQKDNTLFEHIDVKPRIFLARCNNCNNDTEVRVDTVEEEKVSFCCRYCSPAREGALDVFTGDAVWFG